MELKEIKAHDINPTGKMLIFFNVNTIETITKFYMAYHSTKS